MIENSVLFRPELLKRYDSFHRLLDSQFGIINPLNKDVYYWVVKTSEMPSRFVGNHNSVYYIKFECLFSFLSEENKSLIMFNFDEIYKFNIITHEYSADIEIE